MMTMRDMMPPELIGNSTVRAEPLSALGVRRAWGEAPKWARERREGGEGGYAQRACRPCAPGAPARAAEASASATARTSPVTAPAVTRMKDSSDPAAKKGEPQIGRASCRERV